MLIAVLILTFDLLIIHINTMQYIFSTFRKFTFRNDIIADLVMALRCIWVASAVVLLGFYMTFKGFAELNETLLTHK